MNTRIISCALACALVGMAVQVRADEVWFNPPFVSGKGEMEMFIRVSTDSSEILYAGDSSIGAHFAVDPYSRPGYLELHVEIPSMMWVGNLCIGTYNSPPVALGARMTVPSILMNSSAYFAAQSEGRFDIDTFHRRGDGIVDLFSGNFYQPNQQGSDIAYEYGYIHFEIPCVPEPSALSIALMSLALLMGGKYGR